MYTLVIGNKNYSSWSLRGWLLLRQFQIGFDEIRLPLYSEAFTAKIRDFSPTGLVPVLVAGELSIWDSLAICEYIAEQHPHLQCWPEDVQARAIDAISENLTREIERVCEIWKTCRQFHAPAGDFLFGRFSIADVMYAPVVLRFKSYHIEVGKIEADYMNSMLALDSLQEWIEAAQAEEEVIEIYEK